MAGKLFQIQPQDNAAVALADIAAGETVTLGGISYTAQTVIPAGHKMAIRPIRAGEDVLKYGFPIGTARRDVAVGEHLHTDTVKSKLGDLLDYRYEPEKAPHWDPAQHTYLAGKTFDGYARPDGRAGIRNEIWIIPMVGCVNAIAQAIEKQAQIYKEGTIDGIYAYGHPYGCSQLGDDMTNTQKYLAALVQHPNAGGVLVLGLGCENNEMREMRALIGDVDERRVKFLLCQEVSDEIEAGTRLVAEIARAVRDIPRTPQPVAKLVLGLKCGGSDGFSGITANPLVGEASNELIAAGGTSILTEVPEMFGAETLLMNRAKDVRVFEDTVQLINGFKEYFMRHGEKVDENPSPGNKAGGITTLEDKSLGCVQKGGIAPVVDVLDYGDRVTEHGLSLLCAPGNDLVASNALAAAGAHIVLFTTGRGTPFACPVPTVKIASNPHLASYKSGWIDFSAGRILEGASMREVTADFLDLLLDIASGRAHAKSEALDKHDLAIFKDGVTL